MKMIKEEENDALDLDSWDFSNLDQALVLVWTPV